MPELSPDGAFMMRSMRALAIAVVLLVAVTGAVSARQEPVTRRARVEYIAGANVYIALGEEAGIVTGDTLRAMRADRGEGRVRVIASSTGRSVLAFAGQPFPLTRGDTLVIVVSTSDAARRVAANDTSTGDARDPRPDSAAVTRVQARMPSNERQAPRRAASPIRMSGMIAFDLDALDSETRWGTGPTERVERRFVTPSTRLYATLANLPGGMRINTNLRYEYRSTDGTAFGSSTALRIYQASLAKEFDVIPLSFELGRFYNPSDIYGGYWDGGMVRVGRRNAGIGVAAGFEPDRVNGGFDGGSRKLSVFADYAYRGRSAGYSFAVAAHDDRGDVVEGGRFVSLTQRLRVGRASVQQRMRVNTSSDWSAWSLVQLDLNATTPVAGNLYVRGHYSRRSWSWDPLEPDTARPQNDRRGGGLYYSGSQVYLSADASLTQWNDGEQSKTYSGSLSLQRTPLAGIGFGTSGSFQQGAARDTWYLAPWLSRSFGYSSINAGWQMYGTSGSADDAYHAASLSLTLPLPGGAFTSLRGQKQFGASSSNRIFVSLWKSF
jgi:hypothetical protein